MILYNLTCASKSVEICEEEDDDVHHVKIINQIDVFTC